MERGAGKTVPGPTTHGALGPCETAATMVGISGFVGGKGLTWAKHLGEEGRTKASGKAGRLGGVGMKQLHMRVGK